ncbi:TPA: hypothetical protein ACXIPZ_002139, partial [Neisseria meningitidis]
FRFLFLVFCPCGNDEILSFRNLSEKTETAPPSFPHRLRHSRAGFVIPAFVNPLYFRRFLHFRQNLSTKNNTSQIKTIISFAKIPPPPVNINKNNY